MTLQHYARNKTKVIPETILAITSCCPNRNESYPNVFKDCFTASNASSNEKKLSLKSIYEDTACSLHLVKFQVDRIRVFNWAKNLLKVKSEDM